MKCPACDHQLSEVTENGLTIDICQGGCGGIFFDQFELKKVDEPGELTGERIVELQKQAAFRPSDQNLRRKCPKCEDVTMMRHFFSVKRQVLVDECAGCGGVWLDPGELDKIRSEGSQADRDADAQKYFNQMFDPQLEFKRAESEKESYHKLGRLFSFFQRKRK